MKSEIERATDDRDQHPWRYYSLEPDLMRRMLDHLSQRAEAAEATVRQELQAERDYLRDCVARQAAAITDKNAQVAALERVVAELKGAATRAIHDWEDIGRPGRDLYPDEWIRAKHDCASELRAVLAGKR